MKKSLIIIAAAFFGFASQALAQSENNDDEIIVTDAQGKQEVIDLPEALTHDYDSLLNNYNSKTYLHMSFDCNMPDVNPVYSAEVYKERLSRIPTIIELPYNDVVQKFIDRYSGRLRRSVSVMLGAQNFYMPIFEEALESYGLPLELKYLPVIESAFVFFMKREMPALLQKALLGFASGVMVAASVWSLLIPSMEMTVSEGWTSVLPASVGFLAGIFFLLAIDYLTPHLHIGEDKPEGPKSKISKTAMLALAVTIHNIPEGMAVGVLVAGAMSDGMAIAPAAAMATAIGIAVQNVPEGAIISMPMRAAGNSRMRSFLIGGLSGIVEPVGALLVILLASLMTPILPYFLAFAAGAMIYVVVEELIPEASEGQHSNIGTVGFAVGFVLMMVLDVVLG